MQRAPHASCRLTKRRLEARKHIVGRGGSHPRDGLWVGQGAERRGAQQLAGGHHRVCVASRMRPSRSLMLLSDMAPEIVAGRGHSKARAVVVPRELGCLTLPAASGLVELGHLALRDAHRQSALPLQESRPAAEEDPYREDQVPAFPLVDGPQALAGAAPARRGPHCVAHFSHLA